MSGYDADNRSAVVPDGAEPQRWIRLTVSCTAEQHQWLRQQAFEERISMAGLLRRCMSEARDRRRDPRQPLDLPPSPFIAGRRSATTADEDASPRWVHLNLGFTAEQHEWLRRRAWLERTTLAALVRQCVSDVRDLLDAQLRGTSPRRLARRTGGNRRRAAVGSASSAVSLPQR
jgi:hypothetical protein